MSLIKGIHHVSMKCSSTEEYEKTIDFYKNILEIGRASCRERV